MGIEDHEVAYPLSCARFLSSSDIPASAYKNTESKESKCLACGEAERFRLGEAAIVATSFVLSLVAAFLLVVVGVLLLVLAELLPSAWLLERSSDLGEGVLDPILVD
jgi:hypothetical protein